MHFSLPTSFDDPQDCAYVPNPKDLSSKDKRRLRDWLKGRGRVLLRQGSIPLRKSDAVKVADYALKNMRQANLTRLRVACFSECGNNPRMWSLYGGNGAGFCLKFRTGIYPLDDMEKVRYIPKPLPWDISAVERGDDGWLRDLIRTKSCKWQYEKEWRRIVGAEHKQIKYDPAVLATIFLGTKACLQTVERIQKIIEEQELDVALR